MRETVNSEVYQEVKPKGKLIGCSFRSEGNFSEKRGGLSIFFDSFIFEKRNRKQSAEAINLGELTEAVENLTRNLIWEDRSLMLEDRIKNLCLNLS